MLQSNTGTYGKITQEGIDTLHRRMHQVHPIEQPFLRYVNATAFVTPHAQ